MMNKHKIIFGDSRRMSELGDNSVHLIITSPPYWQLKDYGVKGQIGFDDSYEDYINNLNLVWNECHRVLHPGCRMCINIGDQFARAIYYGRYKVVPIRTEITKFCETVGFDYMGAIIWQKVTTTNTTGGATVMGSYPYPRNGILKIDYEFILIFKKCGRPPKVKKDLKEKSKLTLEEWNDYFTGHWNFPGERQDKHLAMFPKELPHRLVKMFSFIGDTILDPFLGSGTTVLAAKNLKRNSVGYEINKSFSSIIQRKLKLDGIFNDDQFELVERVEKDGDFHSKLENLPYIFKDPVKFDKKVDPRKLKFGSRIDNADDESINYYLVKDVISPEILVLNNGLRIRLLGVKTDNGKNVRAKEFLREKTRNQRVFMKFDEVKYDINGNLLCYLYLKNKTFINAHLIKKGLADVDTSFNYKYKSTLISYRKALNG
ncbi:MAG: thermonuclease family protein [candidate division Zixibacteria bacterium]|nr:thermonuclease family protein [Candidatus Tariuqbacter arcticus]